MWRPARRAVVFMMRSNVKMSILLFNLAAAAMALYAVSLLFTSNFNMGNLLVWLLAAAMVGYAVFRRPLNAWFSAGVGRAVWWVLVIGLAVYGLLLGFVAFSGYANAPTGQEQVLVVLGAGLRGDRPSLLLRYRLDKAYEYAVEHPGVLVVTSGGQGRDEWVPEGRAMRDYLINKGLDPERILAECKSTSTEENFAFSLALLREHGYDEKTPIVYTTNAFHCYRAGQYAKMAGFTSVSTLPAATPLRSALPSYLREVMALLYYWVFRTSSSGAMQSMVGLLSLSKKFFYQ